MSVNSTEEKVAILFHFFSSLCISFFRSLRFFILPSFLPPLLPPVCSDGATTTLFHFIALLGHMMVNKSHESNAALSLADSPLRGLSSLSSLPPLSLGHFCLLSLASSHKSFVHRVNSGYYLLTCLFSYLLTLSLFLFQE